MPSQPERVAKGSVLPTASSTSNTISSPLDAFSSISAQPSTRGPQSIVLKDPVAVEGMMRRVLDRGAKQLEACYNNRLKSDRGFRGAWDVDLRVTVGGGVEAVRVRSMGERDAEMEGCIKRRAERWTFQRISEPYEVSRVFRFDD